MLTSVEVAELSDWLNKNRAKNKNMNIITIIEKLFNFYDSKMNDKKFLKLSTDLISKKDEIKCIKKFSEDKEFYIVVEYIDCNACKDSIKFKTEKELETAFNEIQNLLK